MEKKKILIVEDDETISSSLVTTLKSVGYEVLTATSGKTGIDAAIKTQPNLIISDLMLPDLNGEDMIAEIRKDPWGKKAKIIVLTNIDEAQIKNKLVLLDVTEYLVKVNTPLSKLLETVAKIVK